MSKKVFLVSILLVIILIGSSIMLYYVFFPGDRDVYGYSIILDSVSAATYKIDCPVPVDVSGNVYAHFIDEIKIEEGSANLSMKTTSHGIALEISGKGRVTLRWNASLPTSEDYRFYNLSMTSDTHINGSTKEMTWIYSDSENISLQLNCRCEFHPEKTGAMSTQCVGASTRRMFNLPSYSLAAGWNYIEIEYGAVSHLGC